MVLGVENLWWKVGRFRQVTFVSFYNRNSMRNNYAEKMYDKRIEQKAHFSTVTVYIITLDSCDAQLYTAMPFEKEHILFSISLTSLQFLIIYD